MESLFISTPKAISLQKISNDLQSYLSNYYSISKYNLKWWKKDIFISHHYTPIKDFYQFKKRVLIQPIDGTVIKKDIIDNMNLYDLIITPSEVGKQILLKNGIYKKIEVIPNYYDFYNDNDYFKSIVNEKKYTFYTESSGIERKNITNLLKYFIKNFNNSVDVRLIIKVPKEKSTYLRKIADESNIDIVIIDDFLSSEDLYSIMNNIDCYICLSYMEGFCIPLLNAYILKKDIITLDSDISGYKDFLNKNNAILLPCSKIPIKEGNIESIYSDESIWEEVDYKEYMKALNNVYNGTYTFIKDVNYDIYKKENILNMYREVISNVIIDDKIVKTNEEIFKDINKILLPTLDNKYPIINENSLYKTLIVESRYDEGIEYTIRNTIKRMGNGWGHIIVCTNDNIEYIEKLKNDISDNIEIINLGNKSIDRNSYNNLMLDIKFWDLINCEKVLIYQTDTFIFKDFDKKFLEYDYIGAPWGPSIYTDSIKKNYNLKYDIYLGNGGLSLRTVSVLKDVLSNIIPMKNHEEKYDFIFEDLFYSYNIMINKLYKLAPLDIASEFSFEHKYHDDTFGCHQPYVNSFYNDEVFKNFLNKVKKYL